LLAVYHFADMVPNQGHFVADRLDLLDQAGFGLERGGIGGGVGHSVSSPCFGLT
jgi:hypothetical protein